MTDAVETEKPAQRLPNVLVDARVEVDLDASLNWYWINKAPTERERLDRRAQEYADAIKSFHEFVRDHRSQDHIKLHLVRVTQDQCSECDSEWETFREEGVEYCANCGTPVVV